MVYARTVAQCKLKCSVTQHSVEKTWDEQNYLEPKVCRRNVKNQLVNSSTQTETNFPDQNVHTVCFRPSVQKIMIFEGHLGLRLLQNTEYTGEVSYYGNIFFGKYIRRLSISKTKRPKRQGC